MLLNNVYDPLDVNFCRESSNKRDGESTSKETETQRKISVSENNNIHRNIARKILPGNRSYSSTTDYG